MFGIGPMEIAIILIFALVFVGPQKLPDLARQFGRFFVQMKRMTSDVRSTFDDYVKKAEQELLAEDREKIRKLLSKDLVEPLKTIDAELKNQVNDALSPSHHGAENHPSDHDGQQATNGDSNVEDEQKPEGSKDTGRPAAGQGLADWEKSNH
jgi:sec-independent protein translocase protein TatB